jgi:hypothetical protein
MFTNRTHQIGSRSYRAVVVSIALVLALLPGATAALAQPGGQAVPFRGTWQATEITVGFVFPILHNVATVSGNATQLGQYTAAFEVFVNVSNDPPTAATSTVEFSAANSDKLFSEGTGTSTFGDAPGTYNIVEQHTITGGTGRFAGATGSFTVKRVIAASGVTSGTFDGTIVLAH